MYRVALCATAAVALGACSLGSGSISSGFNESDTTASITSSPQAESVALGGEPKAPRAPAVAGQQYAKLDDQAPNGSYEKAPTGALADRDYSHTALDAERARDIINQYRKDKGLKPLKLNAELSEAAKAHSRDLAKWDRISHYGSDGSNPWDRVKRVGFKARLAAENVGTGQVDFNEVMRGWKESPGHNKNLLLGDATHMGIALVQDPRTEFKSFWTLVIGTPM
ncbi:CAP domain-containing protein [Hyphomicrobium sp. xq]|uniref:CAP domain-containing protein n=1 Tax=Hyphomicrobium album TaxID=2665159 RepID=A0A6I3KHP8_9HYPH|nr:CAP domain-containing protein [Hyphomicrobium album]MTD95205.1 CAP domain-containing protein [Hyphomicrobium album]